VPYLGGRHSPAERTFATKLAQTPASEAL
jgi:hypothetical protein